MSPVHHPIQYNSPREERSSCRSGRRRRLGDSCRRSSRLAARDRVSNCTLSARICSHVSTVGTQSYCLHCFLHTLQEIPSILNSDASQEAMKRNKERPQAAGGSPPVINTTVLLPNSTSETQHMLENAAVPGGGYRRGCDVAAMFLQVALT